MTCFISEKEPCASKNTGDYPGLTCRPRSRRWATRASSRPSSSSTATNAPPRKILGGEDAGLGKGFPPDDGRTGGRPRNVAARGVGIAQRALELGLRYPQERKTFGKPIAQHQAIQFKLADMVTKVTAARLLTLHAARLKDAGSARTSRPGWRSCSPRRPQAARRGLPPHRRRLRLLKEYEIERLYRDAPLLLIGEGTSEIQRMVIGRKLLQRHKIYPPGPGA